MIKTLNYPKKKCQKLKIPSRSEKLAEETGIHIGDGSMNLYRNSKYGVYTFSGHAIDDQEFAKYFLNLMKQLYNLWPSYERIQKNNLMITCSRTELVRFKHKLRLPLGPKNNINIPGWIKTNNHFSKACVRGIFATDGCFVLQKKYRKIPYYPMLSISTKSKKLAYDVQDVFFNSNIKSSVYCEKIKLPRRPNHIYKVCFYGFKNLSEFVKNIGFLNPKHIEKMKKMSVGGFERPTSR